MSNAVYPTLPGLAFGTQRNLLPPPVKVRTTPSQREFRARDATAPRYAYSLVYDFLRADAAWAELQTLVGFYASRGGPFDSFLFTDVDDCTATLQAFGTGNASTTSFQLTRAFGGFAEAVVDTNSAPLIYIDGVLKTLTTHYTLPGGGVVSFNTAPASGALLTWSGTYYRRCRFDGVELDTTKFMQALWEAKRVQLISIKA